MKHSPTIPKAQNEKGAELIKECLLSLQEQNFKEAKEHIIKAEKIYRKYNTLKQTSICLSIRGLIEYMLDKNNMQYALSLLEDGHHMADMSGESTAKLFYEFCCGSIDYCENKANIYPVSNIRNTNLDPVRESRLISSTFKEDHFIKSKVIVKSTNPTSFGGELPATTSYADDFGSKPMKVSKPMRPLENPHPFSTFPTVEETESQYTPEDVQAQTRENIQIGRMNRNVFKSKTIL